MEHIIEAITSKSKKKDPKMIKELESFSSSTRININDVR